MFLFLSALVSIAAFASVKPTPPNLTNDDATAMVKDWLDKTEIDTATHYCAKGMVCRTVYTMKEKATGARSKFYYDTFYSTDRQVGSACYYIPVAGMTDRYYQMSDLIFDGKLAITAVPTDQVQVVEQHSGIAFKNLVIPRLGTTIYLLGSLTYAHDKATLEGTLYDAADPSLAQFVTVDYPGIRP